jgi:hypothetical protein
MLQISLFAFLDNEQTPKLDMKVTWSFFNHSVLFPFRRGCRDRIKVAKYKYPFTSCNFCLLFSSSDVCERVDEL